MGVADDWVVAGEQWKRLDVDDLILLSWNCLVELN